jgi:hypothetical protein
VQCARQGSCDFEEHETWLYVMFGDGFDTATTFSKYVRSCYFVFTTLCTIGYGDIRAGSCAFVLWFPFLLLWYYGLG